MNHNIVVIWDDTYFDVEVQWTKNGKESVFTFDEKEKYKQWINIIEAELEGKTVKEVEFFGSLMFTDGSCINQKTLKHYMREEAYTNYTFKTSCPTLVMLDFLKERKKESKD